MLRITDIIKRHENLIDAILGAWEMIGVLLIANIGTIALAVSVFTKR